MVSFFYSGIACSKQEQDAGLLNSSSRRIAKWIVAKIACYLGRVVVPLTSACFVSGQRSTGSVVSAMRFFLELADGQTEMTGRLVSTHLNTQIYRHEYNI